MNHLQNVEELHNRYFVLRHGESKANTQQIIVSDPRIGLFSFGLTEKGIKQVQDSVYKNTELNEHTIIYSSDFKRTKETAKIAKDILGVDNIHFTESLRERFFGNFEGTHSRNYNDVWENDKISIDSIIENTETVTSVLHRVTTLLIDLEKQYTGKNILLVSHGDTLEILGTAFLKLTIFSRDQMEYIKTGEIREVGF